MRSTSRPTSRTRTSRRSRTSATRSQRVPALPTSSCARTGRPVRSRPTTRARTPVAARATRPSRIAARAARWQTRRSARPLAYAIDKNEINTRLLGGNAQVANTERSARRAWFYADQTAGDLRPGQGQADPRRRRAGPTPTATGSVEKNGLKAKIELCTTTRQVRQDTLALISALAQGRRHRQRDQPGRSRPRSSPTTTRRHERHPVRPRRAATSTSPSTLRARRSTRCALYTGYHSSQFRPTGPTTRRSGPRHRRRHSIAIRDNVDFAKIKDAMAQVQKIYVDKTIEVPLYYRKQVDLATPQASATTPPTRPRPVRPGTPRTGSSASRPPVCSDSQPERRRPLAGAPFGYPAWHGSHRAVYLSAQCLGPARVAESDAPCNHRSRADGRTPMTKFVIRRIVQAIPVLFGITIVVYGILLAAPGGPTAKFANNPQMTRRAEAKFKQAWGLDQPIPVQYCRWMGVLQPGVRGTRARLLPPPAAFIGPTGWPNFLPDGDQRRRQRRPPRRLRLLDRLGREGQRPDRARRLADVHPRRRRARHLAHDRDRDRRLRRDQTLLGVRPRGDGVRLRRLRHAHVLARASC